MLLKLRAEAQVKTICERKLMLKEMLVTNTTTNTYMQNKYATTEMKLYKDFLNL